MPTASRVWHIASWSSDDPATRVHIEAALAVNPNDPLASRLLSALK